MPEYQQTQRSKKTNTIFQNQATPVVQTPVSNPYSIIQRAKINPRSLTRADIMQLQRTIGNQAVGRLLTSIGNSSTAQQAPVQRQEMPEEEKCPSCMQRQEIPEEEEPLQGKFETVQQQETPEEEEPLQGKFETVQRQEIPEEEEPLQTKSENNTGMPDNLKAGVESLSGIDMSDVRVHYNSEKPAEVGALAYTQGTSIHVAPGQEKHLSHEAWHVVQQKQDRVKPTMLLKGLAVNDDISLEREADEIADVVLSAPMENLIFKSHEDKSKIFFEEPQRRITRDIGEGESIQRILDPHSDPMLTEIYNRFLMYGPLRRYDEELDALNIDPTTHTPRPLLLRTALIDWTGNYSPDNHEIVINPTGRRMDQIRSTLLFEMQNAINVSKVHQVRNPNVALPMCVDECTHNTCEGHRFENAVLALSYEWIEWLNTATHHHLVRGMNNDEKYLTTSPEGVEDSYGQDYEQHNWQHFENYLIINVQSGHTQRYDQAAATRDSSTGMGWRGWRILDMVKNQFPDLLRISFPQGEPSFPVTNPFQNVSPQEYIANLGGMGGQDSNVTGYNVV